MSELRQKNYRYAGTRPYTENDKSIFFGRSEEAMELFSAVANQSITVIHSKSGHGKTSLINAGFVPLARKAKIYDLFTIRLGNFSGGEMHNSPLTSFFSVLKESSKIESYIDKLIPNQESIWICLKKMQVTRKKTSVFIFDQFEEFFSYPPNEQLQFLFELKKLLTQIIPSEYKAPIKESLTKYNSLLSPEGQDLLYSKIDLKIIFSLRTDSISELSKVSKILPEVLENQFYLKPLLVEEAKKALLQPALYKPRYEGLETFESPTFSFSEKSINLILEILTDKLTETIEPYRLQIICSFLEQKIIKDNTTEINIENKEEVIKIQTNYYDNFISELGNENQQQAARIFIEEGLILENEKKRLSVYQGVIPSRYNISLNLLQKLSEGRLITSEKNAAGDTFYELSHETLVETVLSAKKRRLIAENKKLEELNSALQLKKEAEKQLKKTKKTKVIALLIAGAFFISLGLIFYVNNLRKQAKKSELRAQSSLLSVYAYQALENDPTISYRLAQKAYKTDPTNPAAASALVNSYYQSEVFYQEKGKIPKNAISAKFSPDKTQILVATRNPNTNTYQFVLTNINGELIFTKKYANTLTFITFCESRNEILVADRTGNIIILDQKGNEKNHFKVGQPVWLAKYSPDGKKLIISSGSKGVQLYTADGNFLKDLPQHDFDVYSANFSPNGKMLVTADNISINLCDSTGNLVRKIELPTPKSYYFPQVSQICFSPNSTQLLITVNDLTGKNNNIQITDLEGNKKAVLRGHSDWITDAKFLPTGKIISSARDNSIIIWTENGELFGKLVGNKSQIFDVCQAENENKFFSVGEDLEIRAWKFGRFLNPLAQIEDISDATFSADGLKILVSEKKQAKLCDLTGKEEITFSGNQEKIKSIAISPNQKYIAATCKNNTVTIWNSQGNLIDILHGHNGKINTSVFSSDSNFMLTASNDSSAILWEIGHKTPVRIFNTQSKVTSAKFSPNGKQIFMTEFSGKSSLFERNGTLKKEFEQSESPLLFSCFSPDGNFIASVNEQSEISIFNLSGEKIRTFANYRNKISSVEFSPNNKNIMISGSDNYVRIFTLSGKELIKLKHNGKVLKATYSPDGNYILSVSQNKSQNIAKLWVIDPEKIIELTDKVKIFGDFKEISLKEYEN